MSKYLIWLNAMHDIDKCNDVDSEIAKRCDSNMHEYWEVCVAGV